MSRQLTPDSTLDNLKKEAKRWLKALRAQDEPARARLRRAYPGAPAEPGLRDVQYALAREHGLASWTALVDALGDRSLAHHGHAERVAWFLEHACNDHRVINGAAAHETHRQAAARFLKQYPVIARDSLYTAVVCGELEEVERRLTARPQAAGESGGPKGWPPLLYLCFGRAPLAAASENAVAIARALLDGGADPNAYYHAPCPYSALVGVAGEGEEDAPPHPQAEALARLLLERGAEPYDIQLLFNTHFHDDVRWLEVVYTHSVRLGRQRDWDDPHWSMLNFGGHGSGARFLLRGAVTRNQLQRAAWILEHGASPNAPLPPHSKLPQRTLHGEALCRGFTEMADLLLRFGATPGVPPAEDPFQTACLQLDRAAAQALIDENPEYLRKPGPMTVAAEQDRVEVAAFLLDLGMSPDIEDPHEGRQRPLHVAAYSDSPRVAALLIERGAVVDPRESNWGGTPLSLAIYAQKPRMIELLSRVSREVFPLAALGKTERLRELLRDEPALARVVKDGRTPLMGLPDDEARALEIVELFLAHGADPTLRNNEGLTAADCARKRSLDEAADRLNG